MKFGHMILRNIFKLLQPDVRLWAKMHQIQFRLRLRPRPAGRAYSTQTFQLDFRGLLLREKG